MKKLAVVIWIIITSCYLKKDKTEVKPVYKGIIESVYASLIVIPTDAYYVQSATTGIIETVNVEEGDLVKKGDILFTIKNSNSKNSIYDAEISLANARENYLGKNNLLKNIEVELVTAHEELKQDSINYIRVKNLWSKGYGTKVDVENAELKYEVSSNSVALLMKKHKQLSIDLNNAYKKSLNKLDNEKNLLKDYTVYSLLDGKVYGLFKEAGELILPQERFAEIGNMDSFKIKMDVDEVDITKVNLGDTAIIILDAYPNEIFTALVSNILPKKDEQNLTYSIEGLFVKKPDKLLYGLSGEANIIVDKRNKVLTIPTRYLSPNNEVETVNGMQKVITGIKNLDFVEIVSGIDTTAILIQPNP